MDIDTLVQSAMKGKQGAFYELMQIHKIKLYKIAFSFMKNEEDLLEAIQEVTYEYSLHLPSLTQVEVGVSSVSNG